MRLTERYRIYLEVGGNHSVMAGLAKHIEFDTYHMTLISWGTICKFQPCHLWGRKHRQD